MFFSQAQHCKICLGYFQCFAHAQIFPVHKEVAFHIVFHFSSLSKEISHGEQLHLETNKYWGKFHDLEKVKCNTLKKLLKRNQAGEQRFPKFICISSFRRQYIFSHQRDNPLLIVALILGCSGQQSKLCHFSSDHIVLENFPPSFSLGSLMPATPLLISPSQCLNHNLY